VYTRTVSSPPKLRFVVKRHPVSGAPGELKPRPRGRPKNFKPLLVALDEILRRGPGTPRRDEEGFFRVRQLKRGPRSKGALTPKREALIQALADDWNLSYDTVWDYLYDHKRFYYVRALGLVEALRQWPIQPRLTLADIGRAVAEYRPGNSHLRSATLAGLEFNLLPYVDTAQQPKQHVALRAVRNRASIPK
jgi:hypothetical protein